MRLAACLPVLVSSAIVLSGASAAPHADGTAIDLERSRLTISVYKSGVFSAFADNHTIRARLHSGSLSADPPRSIRIGVLARELQVLDPDLAADKRREVQTRMLGPEVLSADTYPEIAFASTSVEPAGADRWTVAGRLTIHGQTQTTTFTATSARGAYRGSVRIKQRDFGITPISIAGGTVKVKDELLVEFEIVPAPH
jgi:YceI-like protein